jgi:hypothetical protein
MPTRLRLAVAIALCLIPRALLAQSASTGRGAFVDVPLGPDWDDARDDYTRAPGATWGSGVAFGFDSGKSGIEFDVGVPQWHVRHTLYRYQYAGADYGYALHGHFYEESQIERRRSIDATAMRRASLTINRRAAFTWLVGGGFVYRPDEVTTLTREVLPNGQLKEVNSYRRTSSRNYVAATARADVELRVAPRVSVVPRLRVTAFPSFLDDGGLAPRSLIAKPEVAVRWSFGD